MRLFSESAENIGVLKVDLDEAKKRLGARNKQLNQLWYRSVTLRHIISLLDQIEGIAKVVDHFFYHSNDIFFSIYMLHLHLNLALHFHPCLPMLLQ